MFSTRVRTMFSAVAAAYLAGTVPASAAIIGLFTLDGTTDVTKYGAVTAPTLTLNESSGYVLGTSFTDAEGQFHSAGNATTWTNTTSGNAWWLLDVDTTGYQGLSLRFDNISTSGVGATSIDIGWAVNGGPFTTIQTLQPLSSSWTGYTVDLSGIAAIQDTPNVQLRGLWGTDGTGANTRLDNIQLTGMPAGLNLLAYFPFTGNSLADVANAADVAVSDISRVGTGTLGFNSTAVTTVSGAPAATLSNLHTSTGEYFTFTMTPDPGYQLLLESFEFWARSGDATVPFEVLALIDGSATPMQLLSETATAGFSEYSYAWETPLTVNDEIEFRIRGYNSGSSARTLRIDDVTVFGTVVPEPSTLILLGMAVVGLLGFRRRRQHSIR